MDGLTHYRVTLKESPGDKGTIVFDCWAEDSDHADEQADNAYPGCELVNTITYPCEGADIGAGDRVSFDWGGRRELGTVRQVLGGALLVDGDCGAGFSVFPDMGLRRERVG